MTTLYALGFLLFAQTGPAIVGMETFQDRETVREARNEQREVAYEQLAEGEVRQAIARLEAARKQYPEDPALLINLGSAYAQAGDQQRAADYYHAAMRSDVRYRLELADSTWIDSRRAARMALNALEGSELALRDRD